MSIVNTTATFTIEPQDVAVVQSLAEAWTQTKKVKRKRQTSAFKCAVIRKTGTKIVFLVFSSGKCVCLASKSTAELDEACSWLAELLATSVITKPVIKNIVYCFKLTDKDGNRTKVDIEKLFRQLYDHWILIDNQHRRHFGNFDPELSPSFIYIPKIESGTKALIFWSGSVNLTGLTSEDQIDRLVHEIQQIVDQTCLYELLSNP